MRLAVFVSLGLLFFTGSLPIPPAEPEKPSFERSLAHAGELRSQGDFVRSFKAMQQALSIALRDRKPSQQGKCLIRMGLLKWDLGEMAESASSFSDARAAFKAAGDLRAQEFCATCLEVIRLYKQGKEDRKAGLLYRSVARFEEAFSRGRETGMPDFELKCLRQQSLAYLDLRQFDLFLKNNKKGLEIATYISHSAEQGRCLNNIGVYHQWHNDYSRAVSHFEKALAVSNAAEDPATEAECLNNLGLIYRELDNFERAQFYLERALARDRSGGDPNAVVMDLVNIGAVLLSRGIEEHTKDDLLKALEIFRDCLRLQDLKTADRLVIFVILNNMGIIRNELGDPEGARRHFERAAEILDPAKDILERCQAQINIAASYLREQNVEQALFHFRSAFDIGAKGSSENVLIEASVGLGQCYERMHDGLSALSFYRRAIETIETMRGRILSESASIGFARNKLEPYERSIHILADRYVARPSLGGLDEIFSVIERARARAFLESVNQARFDLPSSGSPTLAERQRAISGNIARLRTAAADPSNAPELRQAMKQELELEEEKYVRLIQEAKAAGRPRDLRWQTPLDRIDVVQGLLASREALVLEYFLGEERSYLISISQTTAALHLLPGRRMIEGSLRAYLKSIADRSLDPETGSNAAERIGSDLIPVEQEIRSVRTVIVIPDGILHYLPFETLKIRDGNGSRYLVEETSVAYCPSSSALVALAGSGLPLRPRWKKELLAVGGVTYQAGDRHDRRASITSRLSDEPIDFEEGIEYPSLPFSRKEILDISRVFPADTVDVLTGDAATEANVKIWPLTEYRIIHFACHGFLNERYPFRSALALSPGGSPEEDGFLQMREIYGLDVNADLVVLSACQTGQGLMERSEGPMGLSRPFFFAGARSVLASLWPTDDAASRAFMSDLYRAIADGSSASEALSRTKRKMLRSSQWAHPFYWAAFMLQGDPSTAASATRHPLDPTGGRRNGAARIPRTWNHGDKT
ncbi:MAG: CHAT domain-containing tetratricopeptide repeat protein [Acidobacteriota bacterium]